MESTTQNNLILFADNAQIIKNEFLLHNTLTKKLAALLYAQAGKAIDCEAIRQCYTLIKQNTGIFSAFRGDMVLGMAAMLSLSPNPQAVFDETLKVYDLLKAVKLRPSDFLTFAAYQIASQADASEYENIIARTRSFYDGMKADHFFYTWQDDYIFAAMLGLSELTVESGTERIEQIFIRLKGEFWDKNSVQTLAQVLALGNSDDDAENRVLALRDALTARTIQLNRSYTLPSLGILALLPADIDTIIHDIEEAQTILRDQKGFGSLSISTQKLLMFAAAFVADKYTQNVKDGIVTATISTSITNIIMAQQAAMAAAIAASSAAAASST